MTKENLNDEKNFEVNIKPQVKRNIIDERKIVKLSKPNDHFEILKENNSFEMKIKKKKKKKGNSNNSSTYPSNSGEGAKVNTKVTLKLDPELRKYLSFEKDKILVKVETRDTVHKKNLNMEPYYHGFMARDVADKIQMEDGQFLLRRAEIEKRQIYIITVQVKKEKEHHMIMRTNDGKHFWIRNYCFNSVSDLIRFHMDRLVPIKEGIIITHWVDKDLWLLTHDQVRLQRPLGSGAFGMVFAGFLNLGTFKQGIPVAIKMLKSERMTNDAKLEFLREASIMTEFNSEYVIKFFGVCTQRDPVMIVIEMAEKGSLYDNLKKPKYTGLQYIHSKETLHRDIAARNVLIGSDDRAKIADFGLSLRQTSVIMKEMKKMPIRWLPPETLAFGVYLPESEVWSYGVLLYEVYTDEGSVSLIDCPEFPYFPQDIQAVMNLCFGRKVGKRLDMKEIYKYFNKSDKIGEDITNVYNVNKKILKRVFNFLKELKEYINKHFFN